MATPAQTAAIECAGHLLVVAGPGSGKTTTMVSRIARILREPASKVVAVTFTRDGARELQAKIDRLIKDSSALRRVTVGTFHSITLRHLDAHGRKPRLATPAQTRAFFRRACQQTGQGTARGTLMELQQALEAIKGSLEPHLHPGSKLAWYTHYQETLARHQLVDLQDVMRLAVEYMMDGSLPPLACSHLIVDEAQDNDPIQAAWVSQHKQAIVTMVGDDDQTIYEWRRAIGFLGMLSFQRERSANVILLEDNFRSRSEIVQAARSLIAHNNPHRNDKRLLARRGAGGTVQSVLVGSQDDWGTAIIPLLEESLAGTTSEDSVCPRMVPTDSWAVLARTNRQLDLVEAILGSSNIKVARSTGSIWETPPAQLALQILKGLLTGDSIGLEAALIHAAVPVVEVESLIKSHRDDLRALLVGLVPLPPDVSEATRHAVARFATWAGLLGQKSHDPTSRFLGEFCTWIVNGLPSDQRPTATKILAALRQQLVSHHDDLLRTINRLGLGSKTVDRVGAVQLFTMHGAKGLEFDNVIMVGLDRQSIPGEALPLPPGWPGLEPGQSTVHSERCLFYVAMTRAKDGLFLLRPVADPSPFFEEIPHIAPVEVVS